MKKRWRSKSRKSAGPATPDRSGEGASSASAAPAREGGDERMQHRRSEGGEGSPSPGEETAVRPKRRRKEERRGSAWQNDDTILMEGCLSDDELLMYNGQEEGPFDGEETMDKKPKPSCSGDCRKIAQDEDEDTILMDLFDDEMLMYYGQEEAPFDGEETIDNKPKPSWSGDCGKIAQDEDEDGHSDKKPSSVLEDEQHSDKIGVHAIEDHKQEQGGARGHVRALLDMDDETISNNIWDFTKRLNFDSPKRGPPEFKPDQLIKLHEQLALYRIRAYELSMGRNLAELDDVNLKMQYPPSMLYDKDFFKYYEKSLEWYFDPERCKHVHYDNYQRLVLHHCGYLDWGFYHSILNTYEQDVAYVEYFEMVADETKWIEDYLGDNIQWTKVKDLAYMQAMEIAARVSNVSLLLVTYGFHEYIRSIWCDYSRKGLDCLYFEIWKRVAKGKMSFKEALLEIHSKDMIPLRSFEIKNELENTPYRFPIKDYYDAHVAGIDKMASDHKARQLIREAVVKIKMAREPKYYLDYARKKLDIAEEIGLIPEGRRRGVAQQGKGDNGEAKTEMDD